MSYHITVALGANDPKTSSSMNKELKHYIVIPNNSFPAANFTTTHSYPHSTPSPLFLPECIKYLTSHSKTVSSHNNTDLAQTNGNNKINHKKKRGEGEKS